MINYRYFLYKKTPFGYTGRRFKAVLTGRYCRFYWISTITLSPSRFAAALITERIAFAILPCFPMTFPISSGATESVRTISPSSPSLDDTVTLSGSSTIARAISIRICLYTFINHSVSPTLQTPRRCRRRRTAGGCDHLEMIPLLTSNDLTVSVG